MNIGLFGLSGVGKTYLASKFVERRTDFVLTRASKLIKEGNQEIRYNYLDECKVNRNQIALIKGFELFKKNHPNQNIIIELHNLIETPNGPIIIEHYVFDELELDAVCFIARSPKDILIQRKLDETRERSSVSELDIDSYQCKALELFQMYFMEFKTSRICILNSPSETELDEFIRRSM